MEPDLARIAFVTRRFEDLQGLSLAVLGAALVVWSVACTFLPADYLDPFYYVVLPVDLTVLTLMPRIGRYYQRTFGRAPGTSRRRRAAQSSVWAGWGPGLNIVLLGLSVDMIKSLAYPGGVSFCAVAIASHSLWTLMRDWPNRLHYAIGLAAGIASIFVTAAVPITARVNFRIDPLVASEYTLAYALAGLGLLAVGLLDHRLLATAMGRRASANETSSVPDASLSHIRLAISSTCLVALLTCIGLFGWPDEAFTVYMTVYLSLFGSMVVAISREALTTIEFRLSVDQEWARAREERFLAQIAAMKGVPVPSKVDEPQHIVTCAAPDLLGHVALPFSMACGALVDVLSPGSGMPSLLALALAASHLRIATRDWPERGHYLLGSLAGIASAAHYMLMDQSQGLDWVVSFVILVSAAMVVEGLLDLRLARRAISESERHADPV